VARLVRLLAENALLLLFLVAGLGFVIGRIRVKGFGLGVAAVLFVGLAVGALHPSLKLPEFVQQFGLVLFVYTIGLQSGPGFFQSFRKRGVRDNSFALFILVFGALLVVVAHFALRLRPGLTAGTYAGALTNTPALASVLEYLGATTPSLERERALAEPVVAYSLTYPTGVLGVIAAIWIARRISRSERTQERVSAADAIAIGQKLVDLTVKIDRDDAIGHPAEELRQKKKLAVLFGRVRHEGHSKIVTDETVFARGDLVTCVGTANEVERSIALLGEKSDERIDLDRREVDFRRIFVSNAKLVGETLDELRLPERFGAIVTRVRRGDVEFLPDESTVLELGDRVRVVAPPSRMDAISHWFGDSYKALSEMDVITFSVGIALGLLLGILPIPTGAGASFKLGIAGGPLIVGLVLGRLGRTGPLTWSLPFSVNLTVRQLGLVLFLAAVGTRSGYAFVSTFREGGGLAVFAAGAIVTCAVATTALVVGRKVLKIPQSLLVGMVSGVHTQPAALAFACEQQGNELPNLGYAMVFPIATIGKILIAQLLVMFLR